jgi:hypothetical protein
MLAGQINAYTSSAGDLKLDKITKNLDFSQIEKNVVRCGCRFAKA